MHVFRRHGCCWEFGDGANSTTCCARNSAKEDGQRDVCLLVGLKPHSSTPLRRGVFREGAARDAFLAEFPRPFGKLRIFDWARDEFTPAFHRRGASSRGR